jgi:hypothetical protein
MLCMNASHRLPCPPNLVFRRSWHLRNTYLGRVIPFSGNCAFIWKRVFGPRYLLKRLLGSVFVKHVLIYSWAAVLSGLDGLSQAFWVPKAMWVKERCLSSESLILHISAGS